MTGIAVQLDRVRAPSDEPILVRYAATLTIGDISAAGYSCGWANESTLKDRAVGEAAERLLAQLPDRRDWTASIAEAARSDRVSIDLPATFGRALVGDSLVAVDELVDLPITWVPASRTGETVWVPAQLVTSRHLHDSFYLVTPSSSGSAVAEHSGDAVARAGAELDERTSFVAAMACSTLGIALDPSVVSDFADLRRYGLDLGLYELARTANAVVVLAVVLDRRLDCVTVGLANKSDSLESANHAVLEALQVRPWVRSVGVGNESSDPIERRIGLWNGTGSVGRFQRTFTESARHRGALIGRLDRNELDGLTYVPDSDAVAVVGEELGLSYARCWNPMSYPLQFDQRLESATASTIVGNQAHQPHPML